VRGILGRRDGERVITNASVVGQITPPMRIAASKVQSRSAIRVKAVPLEPIH